MLEIVLTSNCTARINIDLVEAVEYTGKETARVVICMASGHHYVVVRDVYEKNYKSHIEDRLEEEA